jgi:drug/metabolite transporter (DMT)-like permease
MSALLQALCVAGLGLFWGISPTFYKLMGEEGIPITHIIVLSGGGIALGLWLIRAMSGAGVALSTRALLYGFGCGLLMNVPFALGLWFSRNMPITVLSVVTSTGPLWTYVIAILLGRERPGPWRMLALSVGFLSSVVLIATRPGSGIEGTEVTWALAAFSCPILYALYNQFAAYAWPADMDTRTAGIVESLASAALALPFLLLLEPIGTPSAIHWGYWTVAVITLIWLIERIAFFTMIRFAGPVTTSQATYVSSPAAVLFGVLLFGERTDIWLWVSLALLLAALWINNRSLARPGQA